jgi:DinB superfamily
MSSEILAMDNVVRDFRETIRNAAERLSRIPEDESTMPPAEGKWSKKEIVGHLIDSAANNHARFVLAQISDNLDFPGYEQERWVSIQRYNEEPWEELVALWKYYNLHLSHLIAVASEATRQQPRTKHSLDRIAFKTLNSEQPATLEYFMRDYIDHLRHHLKQIFGE